MYQKFDNIKLGFILGIIFPLITFFVIYLIRFNDYSIFEFINNTWRMKILTKILSLALISNLLLFFIFIWKNYLYSAKGTLAATIMMAVVVIILKIL